MTYSASQAIARSVSHNEIVTLMGDSELELALSIESEDSAESGSIKEFWGTDEDGQSWRVHLDFTGMVTVETMPEHLRESHRAARNWGVYPHNGAERLTMTRDEADELVNDDTDGYAHIVE